MNQEQKRRERLYNKFKENIGNRSVDSMFDDADLVDIFDYASDVLDEYVQIEILHLAARFYPESDELTVRRAFFLHNSLSMTEGAAAMAEAHRHESPLWDVLWLLVNRTSLSHQQIIEELETIMRIHDSLDDESLIQLVEGASDLGIYSWLKEHKDEIQKHSEFPDTILYELYQEADEQQDFAYAVKLLDELTQLEPFNAHFWHMLAEEYGNQGDFDNALSAIDYALALEPESLEMQIFKAHVLLTLRNDPETTFDYVKEIARNNPDYAPAIHMLATLYHIAGKSNEARTTLLEFLRNHPEDRDGLEHVALLNTDSQNELMFTTLLRTRQFTQEEWIEWGASLINAGQAKTGTAILNSWLNLHGSLNDYKSLIEGLYMLHDYTGLSKLAADHLIDNNGFLATLSLPEIYAIVLSMAKDGQYDALRKLLPPMLDTIQVAAIPLTDHFAHIAIVIALQRLNSLLQEGHDDSIDLSTMDPTA